MSDEQPTLRVLLNVWRLMGTDPNRTAPWPPCPSAIEQRLGEPGQPREFVHGERVYEAFRRYFVIAATRNGCRSTSPIGNHGIVTVGEDMFGGRRDGLNSCSSFACRRSRAPQPYRPSLATLASGHSPESSA